MIFKKKFIINQVPLFGLYFMFQRVKIRDKKNDIIKNWPKPKSIKTRIILGLTIFINILFKALTKLPYYST